MPSPAHASRTLPKTRTAGRGRSKLVPGRCQQAVAGMASGRSSCGQSGVAGTGGSEAGRKARCTPGRVAIWPHGSVSKWPHGIVALTRAAKRGRRRAKGQGCDRTAPGAARQRSAAPVMPSASSPHKAPSTASRCACVHTCQQLLGQQAAGRARARPYRRQVGGGDPQVQG